MLIGYPLTCWWKECRIVTRPLAKYAQGKGSTGDMNPDPALLLRGSPQRNPALPRYVDLQNNLSPL
jgi:hypothetical protein